MSGEALRDEGMGRVRRGLDPWWKRQYWRLASEWFLALPPGTVFNGEAIRLYAEEQGIPPPHHHNGWGAMANSFLTSARQARMIVLDGETSKAVSPQAHARAYQTYRKI